MPLTLLHDNESPIIPCAGRKALLLYSILPWAGSYIRIDCCESGVVICLTVTKKEDAQNWITIVLTPMSYRLRCRSGKTSLYTNALKEASTIEDKKSTFYDL